MRGQGQRDEDYPAFLRAMAGTLWTERALDAGLAGICHPQLIHRQAQAMGFGAGAIRAEALELLAALPDLAVRTEDAICSGAPRLGLLGSQRLLMQGSHDGDGAFGTPSGRRLRFRAMADIYAKDGRISEIWALRDSGAILRQLGLRVSDWARERAACLDPEDGPFHPGLDQPGPYTGQGNGNHWGMAFAALLERIMAAGFSEIPAQYDPAARLAYPGGVTAQGPGGAERFWFGLRAAFPDARFVIHHRIGREDRLLPPRAALRWSLTGRHSGWGAFGRPSGAEVHVMGISHAEFGPSGLRREWTLYDEAAVWMQIHAPRHAAPVARAVAAE
ncbi:ester cyclase [Salipiger abyssi]|uniref:ester cyclase n=1 Tax=Salipiger abyssi TaxID=1250539 RepID=UPI00405A1836